MGSSDLFEKSLKNSSITDKLMAGIILIFIIYENFRNEDPGSLIYSGEKYFKFFLDLSNNDILTIIGNVFGIIFALIAILVFSFWFYLIILMIVMGIQCLDKQYSDNKNTKVEIIRSDLDKSEYIIRDGKKFRLTPVDDED